MMKTKQDNNVTNRISTFYAENNTERSWLIGMSVVCEENKR